MTKGYLYKSTRLSSLQSVYILKLHPVVSENKDISNWWKQLASNMLKLLCCLAVAILGIVKCGDEQRRYRYPEYDRIYPQYMYHPYSYDLYGPDNCNDDCNRRYYPIYAQYLIYFRRRWKEQDYPTFRASRNVTMKWSDFYLWTVKTV